MSPLGPTAVVFSRLHDWRCPHAKRILDVLWSTNPQSPPRSLPVALKPPFERQPRLRAARIASCPCAPKKLSLTATSQREARRLARHCRSTEKGKGQTKIFSSIAIGAHFLAHSHSFERFKSTIIPPFPLLTLSHLHCIGDAFALVALKVQRPWSQIFLETSITLKSSSLALGPGSGALEAVLTSPTSPHQNPRFRVACVDPISIYSPFRVLLHLPSV
ncbi:uncharacterized protein BCR38DRAFT_7593 [Pseudomassariella vexata]|uniref:Uncharacterized protein n=1 Tax=Pseudomassariella vexata TaxID=1141098 RepID=A0A1Y2EJ72_9PEZI|nr:uncharacterized protein BCR38DRAFT_7593 [Pseudomassariella vexata]ORY71296.1 hypothetical protein BCR38DRAFT_7593 [Pseudomassariella vexata]